MNKWRFNAISGLDWIVIILALCGLVFRFYYAWQPLPVLIEQGMSDDAFYYLNIAKNIVLGNGVSFDGITLTNGFHPVFLCFLIPFFIINPISNVTAIMMTRNLELNAQLGLSILLLFNTISVFPLYYIVKKVSSSSAGLITALIWLFNPWVLVISLAGVETAPYIFFVAITSLYYINAREQSRTTKTMIIFGGLSGLTMLSRSDGVFLLFAILLDMSFSAHRRWLKDYFIILCSFGFVVMPWLIWNFVTFGTFTQVSGLAVFQHTHFGLPSSWVDIIRTLWQSTGRMLLVSAIVNYPVSFILILFSIPRVLPRYRAELDKTNEFKQLRFLVFYALMIFGFYAWYLLRKQFWYFMPLIFVVSILAGIMHGSFVRSLKTNDPKSRNIITAMVAVVLIVLFGSGWWVWQSKAYIIYPAEKNGYLLSQWIRVETEPDAIIGSWNSGIIGYLSDRKVINLDGVVNNNLYSLVKGKNISFFDLTGMWDFLERGRINYLTDYEYILADEIIPRFYDAGGEDKLTLIYQFPSVHNQGKYAVQVYKLH